VKEKTKRENEAKRARQAAKSVKSATYVCHTVRNEEVKECEANQAEIEASQPNSQKV
jgi:hypothetical protein